MYLYETMKSICTSASMANDWEGFSRGVYVFGTDSKKWPVRDHHSLVSYCTSELDRMDVGSPLNL